MTSLINSPNEAVTWCTFTSRRHSLFWCQPIKFKSCFEALNTLESSPTTYILNKHVRTYFPLLPPLGHKLTMGWRKGKEQEKKMHSYQEHLDTVMELVHYLTALNTTKLNCLKNKIVIQVCLCATLRTVMFIQCTKAAQSDCPTVRSVRQTA